MEGLVMRTTGSWYKVLPTDATRRLPLNQWEDALVDCRLRGNYRLRGNKQTNPVAVGDRVDYTLQPDGTGVIGEVHDRQNYIVRKATKLSKQTHVIAANLDRLCIVATLAFPRTSTGFIDRLLVTAEAYHIPACIIFNKWDLYDPSLLSLHQDLQAIYTAAGYPVFAVSALSGEGVQALSHALVGQTVLFAGHSGVGKSALLNALAPSLHLRVGQVSDWSLKGKHTTTFAEMHPLCLAEADPQRPTFLIDTPGIKEFGMVDFKPEELSHFFPEMRQVLHGCHFANCTHRHEPRCAVKQAVDQGLISAERYNSYLGIYEQIENGNETW